MLGRESLTLALAAVVVAGDGLLLEEVLQHARDVSAVAAAEVEGEVPSVVEGNRLVAAVAADHLRQQLASEEVTHDRVFTFAVVVPPVFTLNRRYGTIY
jgi:hypothetical protein